MKKLLVLMLMLSLVGTTFAATATVFDEVLVRDNLEVEETLTQTGAATFSSTIGVTGISTFSSTVNINQAGSTGLVLKDGTNEVAKIAANTATGVINIGATRANYYPIITTSANVTALSFDTAGAATFADDVRVNDQVGIGQAAHATYLLTLNGATGIFSATNEQVFRNAAGTAWIAITSTNVQLNTPMVQDSRAATPDSALEDGMMFYHTGRDVFVGRANGAWVDLH